MKINGSFSTWRNDLPSSLVVFLVALPLCLGIALASGAPLISGVIAGAIGGIVAGSLSGSPLGVSGPAAGLTAIVLAAIADLGSFELLLTATVLAGSIQIVLGLLRAGVIAYYFPNSVIKGMLAGIGIIIVLKQVPHAVGYDKDFIGDEAFDQPDHQNTLSELARMLEAISPGAVVITLVCIALMLVWEMAAVKRNKWLSGIPGPLLAVVAGVGLARLFAGSPTLAIGAEHFVDLPVLTGPGDLPHPAFEGLLDKRVWVVAFTIAIVASLETLLCVEATDKLDPLKRVTPANRELHAQGFANMASGLLGGLPVTQVIVRSSANIQAGGRTKLSTILHGTWLLAAVLLVPTLLRTIPLASLAAILLLVGYKLVKPAQFLSMWKAGIMRFLPFFITVVGVAFTDLLKGVGMGIAVAIVHILWKNYRVPFHFDRDCHKAGEPIRIELSEDVTFLNKAGIKRTLNELPEGARVVIDAGRTVDLDPDVDEIIQEFRIGAPQRHIEVECIGFEEHRRPNTKVLFRQVILTAARSFASTRN